MDSPAKDADSKAIAGESRPAEELRAADEYDYTKRNEFTSEVFKIEIMNIPLHSGFSEVRKLLKQRLKLKPNKIKVLSAKQSMYAFVNFRCEEDRLEAIEKITGHIWKNNKLAAKKANPMADPYVQKRKLLDVPGDDECKRMKHEDDSIPLTTKLRNAVIPLWEMPYADQLMQKEADMRKLLVKLGCEIEKINPRLKKWMKAQREKHNGLFCEFLGIKPSPLSENYRNKCEFSIGHRPCLDSDDEIRTVGFRLSRYSDGSMTVVEPDQCFNIDSRMNNVVKAFQHYVQNSDKPPFCAQSHQGYWRQLTVRTTRMDDIMALIVLNPQNLTEDELEAEKKSIVEFFADGNGKECGITSLYLQLLSKRVSGEEPPIYHLFGDKVIKEKLLDLTFHISPEAFFQVNTSGAEVLYANVERLAELDKNTTLLDVCCGTGTIGLSLAQNVAKVMGVEINSSAVEDAKKNTRINEIKNADFFCGKAEDKIHALIQRAPTDDVVAVVDPPRAGLHSRVVKVIRASKQINRMVYVSCNPVAAKSNFLDFCRSVSNNYKGIPLVPVKAVAVDMFPHTDHCELILAFKRFEELDK